MSFPQIVFRAAFGVLPLEIPRLHLRLPGESGDYASTPDSAALDITSDIDLRVVVSTEDWSQSPSVGLIGKAASSQFSYSLELRDNRIRLALSDDGSTVHLRDSDTFDFADFARRGLRADWRASDGRLRFFTSEDEGSSWTQLGSDITFDDLSAIHSGTAELSIGDIPTTDPFEGRVYTATVISDPFGTPVEEANPDFTDTVEWSAGDTTGSDDAGNTWTINQSGDPVAEIRDDWEDISGRVRTEGGIAWTVGRQHELDRMEAGAGTVYVDNSDGALDPTNTTSDFYPMVQPMVKVKLQATHSSTTYDIFEAFVESWPQSYPGRSDSLVPIDVVDGTKLLSMARTSASYSQEESGVRVGALLDAADWASSLRDVDTGQSQVQAYSASQRIVLNAIRDTADAESGVFFIDASGNAAFRDRLSRIVSSSQATFGDASGELDYAGIEPTLDDGSLWNDISVTPEGLTVQRAQDENSKESFGHRWLDRLGSLITTEAEADDNANWLLRRYATPRVRIDRLTVDGHKTDALLTEVLNRAIGDRITVNRRPAGGHTMSEEVFIEQVSHDVRDKTWTTTWLLSPAFDETPWLIGMTGFSEIGETTFVGYAAILPPTPWLVRLVNRFDEWLEGLWNR